VPTNGSILMFNATQYEADVNIYAQVGTVVFSALLFMDIESPHYLQYIVVGIWPQSLFSVNRMPGNLHAFGYGRTFIANITLYEPLDPDDEITSHHIKLFCLQ